MQSVFKTYNSRQIRIFYRKTCIDSCQTTCIPAVCPIRDISIVARKVSSQDKPGFRDSEEGERSVKDICRDVIVTTLQIVKGSSERSEASTRREYLSREPHMTSVSDTIFMPET